VPGGADDDLTDVHRLTRRLAVEQTVRRQSFAKHRFVCTARLGWLGRPAYRDMP
jgi:hypothetical protein